jgi:hypothetical protein
MYSRDKQGMIVHQNGSDMQNVEHFEEEYTEANKDGGMMHWFSVDEENKVWVYLLVLLIVLWLVWLLVKHYRPQWLVHLPKMFQ